MKQYKCLTKDLTRKRKSWVISIHISPPCISWYNIVYIQRPIGEDKQPATKKLWRFYMATPRERPFQSRHRFALHRAVNIHTPAWLNGIIFQFSLKWLTNYVLSFITGETMRKTFCIGKFRNVKVLYYTWLNDHGIHCWFTDAWRQSGHVEMISDGISTCCIACDTFIVPFAGEIERVNLQCSILKQRHLRKGSVNNPDFPHKRPVWKNPGNLGRWFTRSKAV